MRFRRYNRVSSCFVDTMFCTDLSFAPHTMKMIMALPITTHITAQQLCHKLCQKHYDGCGRLAQYTYLPTCARDCFASIEYRDSKWFLGACPRRGGNREVKLGPEDCAVLQSLRTLPATFTNGMNKFKTEGDQLPKSYECICVWCLRLGQTLLLLKRSKEYFVQIVCTLIVNISFISEKRSRASQRPSRIKSGWLSDEEEA